MKKNKTENKTYEVDDEFKLEPPEDIKPAKKVAKKKINNNKKSVQAKMKSLEKNCVQMWPKIKPFMAYFLIFLLAVWLIVQNRNLTAKNYELQQSLSDQIKKLQNQTAQEFVNSRKIYVCDMEKIYQELKIEERNKNFEIEISKLNDEVKSAHKKIESLKEAKVKADYTDVYLNSLVAKRDKTAEDYQNALQQTLANVNKALSEVATELGVNTIFRSKATAVITKYTVDVTSQVLEKINKIQQ